MGRTTQRRAAARTPFRRAVISAALRLSPAHSTHASTPCRRLRVGKCPRPQQSSLRALLTHGDNEGPKICANMYVLVCNICLE